MNASILTDNQTSRMESDKGDCLAVSLSASYDAGGVLYREGSRYCDGVADFNGGVGGEGVDGSQGASRWSALKGLELKGEDDIKGMTHSDSNVELPSNLNSGRQSPTAPFGSPTAAECSEMDDVAVEEAFRGEGKDRDGADFSGLRRKAWV